METDEHDEENNVPVTIGMPPLQSNGENNHNGNNNGCSESSAVSTPLSIPELSLISALNVDDEDSLQSSSQRQSPVMLAPMIDPETAAAVVEAKKTMPGMFISGWEGDENEGVYEKDMMDEGEQVLTAAEDGDLELLEELLTAKPSLVGARDIDQYTPLHRACYNDHPAVANRLLERGADPMARTVEGWTPLHSAACWGSFASAQVLLDSGRVNANARTNGQLTPLHLAVASTEKTDKAKQVVALLLKHNGIDIHPVSAAGETPKQIAYRTHPTIYKLFECL